MNIYKVSRTDEIGWDEYSAMVVVAESSQSARQMHPAAERSYHTIEDQKAWESGDEEECYAEDHCWVKYKDIDKLVVEEIGIGGGEPRVILSSYHAG